MKVHEANTLSPLDDDYSPPSLFLFSFSLLYQLHSCSYPACSFWPFRLCENTLWGLTLSPKGFWGIPSNHSGSLLGGVESWANTTCSLLITSKWFYCSPLIDQVRLCRLAHWSKYIEVFIVGDRIPGSCSLSSHTDSKSWFKVPLCLSGNRKKLMLCTS